MKKVMKQKRKVGKRNRVIFFLSMLLCLVGIASPQATIFAGSEEQSTQETKTAEKAPKEKIRVGIYDSPGFSEIEPSGEINGYGYEYLRRLAVYTDWEFEFVKGTWKECIDQLEEGKIDLIGGVHKTKDMLDKFDLSKESCNETKYHVYVNVYSTIEYGEFEKLDGKKVAVLNDSKEGDYLTKLAKEKQITINPVYFDSFSDMEKVMLHREVDAIVASASYTNSNIRSIGELNEIKAYWAVKKGNEDLLSQLNQAQAELLRDELDLPQKLYEKYYINNSKKNVLLSQEETKWVSQAKTYKIGIEDSWKPMAYYDDKNHAYKGILIDTLKLVSKKTGLQFEYVSYSSDDALKEGLRLGEIDAIGLYHNNQYAAQQSKIYLSNEYTNVSVGFLSTVGHQIKNNNVAVAVRSNDVGMQEFIHKNYPNFKLQLCPSLTDCFSLLNREEVDYIADNIYMLEAEILNQSAYQYQINFFATQEYSLCLGLSSDVDKHFVSILNKGLDSIETKEKNEIAIKNTAVSEEVEITIEDVWSKYKVYFFGFFILVIVVMLFIRMNERQSYLRRSLKEQKKYEASLQEALSNAEAANNAKSQFLSRMSHDIRTPMNVIMGMTDIAKTSLEEEDKERVEDCLGKISVSSEYLLSLLNDVLDMSRIESEKISIAHVPFDINGLVHNIKTLMQTRANEKKIDFKVKVKKTGNHKYYGDSLRLNQIFINLLSNAVKFTDKGGKVRFIIMQITCEGNSHLFRFTVTDNGIGIGEEFMEKIFEPFEQENEGVTKTFGGSGLGLSIVKNFVEMMQGTIEVHSKKGEGTSFVVEIPFDKVKKRGSEEEKETIAIPAQLAEQEAEPEKKEVDLTGKKVLLVEDNELNQEIAVAILKQKGLEIEIAANGVEAVNKFKEAEPFYYQYILMDIMMPEMNGWDAAKNIRQLEKEDAKKVPIIAMSANAFEEDKRKSMEMGMNEHILKPINTAVLFETLAKFANGV